MKVHDVKSWPHLFNAAVNGVKKHDLRDMDERDYKVGDHLLFREWDPQNGKYTGMKHIFKITYITSHESPCAMSSVALQRGICILSIESAE